MGIRLTDSTGQAHQQLLSIPSSSNWQSFTVTPFNAGTGYIHYGGKNDGVWHGPVKQVELIMDKARLYAGKTSGDMRFDDIALLAPPSPLSVSDSVYNNTFFENEPVAFQVSTQADTLAWSVTDFWNRPVASGSQPVTGSPLTLALPRLPKGYFTLSVSAYVDDQLLKQQSKAFAVLSNDNPAIAAADSPFGMGTHIGWTAASTKPNFVELLKRAGVKNVRDEVPWSGMEQQKGVYQVVPMRDQYIRLLNQEGIHPLIILDYTNPFYDNNGLPYTEEGIQGYANYGNELANRYGDLIPVLEVYNEYNSKADGTPSKYYNMLKKTYETIKSGHPNTKIIGPAPSYVDIMNWLENLYRLGGLNHLDAVSFHPYNFPSPPEGLEQLTETYRNMIRKYNGGNDKPIWFTEDGWPTHSGGISEQLQASYLVRSYVLALSAGVEKMFWYDFMDDGTNPADPEHHFGIVRNEGDSLGALAPKPAYVSYAVMTRALTGAQFVARDATASTIRSYAFQKDGASIRAIWAVGSKQVKLRTDEPVALTDMMGNTTALTPLDGYVYVSLTGEPLYVAGDVQAVEESDSFILTAAKGVVGEPGTATLHVQNPSGSLLNAEFVTEGVKTPVHVEAGDSTDIPVMLTPAASTGVQHVEGLITLNGNAFGLLKTDVTIAEQLQYRVQPIIADPATGQLSLRFHIVNNSKLNGLPVRRLHWQLGSASGDLDVNDTVAPGSTKAYDFPLSGFAYRTTYAGSFTIDSGLSDTVSFDRNLDFNAISERTIDSDAAAASLPATEAIDLSTGSVQIPGYGGADDASGLIWLNWDRDNLYVTAAIKDNVMAAPASGDAIWQNDGIQFGISQGVPGDSSAWYEMGMAMTPNGPTVYRWLAPAGVPTGVVQNADIHITRDEANTTTTYRLALPWSEIPTLNPAQDVVDSFSFVLNDNDGKGRRGYIEWGSGIATAKDAGKFRSFQFMKDTAAPVTTAAVHPGEPDGSNGWYVHPVSVTLSVYNNLSGAAKTEYSLDGGSTWQSYTNPVMFSQDGKYAVSYRSTDHAGNVEAPQTIRFNLDTKAPSVVLTLSGHSVGDVTADVPVTFELASSDSMSGVAEQALLLDGAAIVSGQANPAGSLAIGAHTIAYRVADAAGNVTEASVAFQVKSAPVMDAGAPGVPVLSSNGGYANGLQDGNYTVAMNMWWGLNGSEFNLYEDGVLVCTTALTKASPAAQTAAWTVQAKANGTYTYVGELINSAGKTVSQPLVVKVTDATPGKPALAHDNWDGDGNFNVFMNLWWGTNATEYRLYENGVLIDTQSLTAATPSAQSAATAIAGKAVGAYEYRCELVNSAGVTSSDKLAVSVTH
ncbi:OmpL47-type beta-barrel domain-containing protein [Cohnella nanjingensis]|uniref:HYR domain-containing protein n=1 Tax=Cohnella nanjingensis TaxID=1387779 RepID=A0A7X0VGT6_9BACL|nr:sugar-binding protein [Cohnella nanjingensis]MBB6673447.1 hypothetical protein [Cohnella nanjingensis]